MTPLPLLTPRFAVRFSTVPHDDHGESLNLEAMSWDDLLKQVRHNPDPKIRRDAAKQAMARVWDGPNQPAERINPRVFEPDW